ncbi:hypothetical protein ASA1KI_16110 [Opitutales bacterium ASA1]|uniref:DUF3450 family protein n=1 Tax=Congregicoccus parvus TaxID=3081749 RepID=UPI002B2F8002|nr:hypothetical protein ASA1KI_16110 [Opitutales bacterium ASA1]
MNLANAGRVAKILPILTCCLFATPVRADVERARSAFAEWAQIKSRIAQEKSEWTREQALLADTLETAKAELVALDRRIDEIKNSSTQADGKRAELNTGIEEAKAASEALAQIVTQSEAEVRSLLPMLPAPLVAELQPLLSRLPAEGARTSIPISQRLQTLAALLAQIEKFGSGLSLLSEIRTLADGEAREVKTLYFGMGAAFFADASGTVAGYGSATPSGWEWKAAEGDAAVRIADAIAIHESTKPPAFVSLPVEIR